MTDLTNMHKSRIRCLGMFFPSLVQALVLKSASEMLYVGKPNRNLLEMVENYEDAERMYIKKGDENNIILDMNYKDYYVGYENKVIKQLAMHSRGWNLGVKKYKILLNANMSYTINVGNNKCVGYYMNIKKLVVGPCDKQDFQTSFVMYKDPKENKMASDKIGLDKNVDRDLSNDMYEKIEIIKYHPSDSVY